MFYGDFVGYAAATLTTVCFIPQALKVIRTRDTRAISLAMYASFSMGVALWLCYGVILSNWPMIIANSVTLLLAGTILALKIRFE